MKKSKAVKCTDKTACKPVKTVKVKKCKKCKA